MDYNPDLIQEAKEAFATAPGKGWEQWASFAWGYVFQGTPMKGGNPNALEFFQWASGRKQAFSVRWYERDDYSTLQVKWFRTVDGARRFAEGVRGIRIRFRIEDPTGEEV
jgi:hypothetical protein